MIFSLISRDKDGFVYPTGERLFGIKYLLRTEYLAVCRDIFFPSAATCLTAPNANVEAACETQTTG